MARVVCVEGWYRGSHAQWADALVRWSRHDIALVTLPGVHWAWRLHGGPVSAAAALPATIGQLGGLDALVATSSVDLASLLGMARHTIGDVPTILYMHENQVTYPVAPGQLADPMAGMATWRSLVAADRIVCNSDFHRAELFDALPAFLNQFPDHREHALIEPCRARTDVVGVGIDVDRFAGPRVEGDRPRILWNHRWEWDKGPDRFVEAMTRLARRGHDFGLVIAGSHLPVDLVRADLGPLLDRVEHLGSCTAQEYPSLLRSCDVVVSTARHEYYGVAIAEAVAAGAVPVVPDGLAYPELLPRSLHREVLYGDDASLDARLVEVVTDGDVRIRRRAALRPAARAWRAEDLVAAFDRVVDAAITGASTGTG